REIMSKLDEILPDTPIFNERGLGVEDPTRSISGSSAPYFETEPGEPDHEAGDDEEPAAFDEEVENPEQARSVQARRPPQAMKATEVERLTRARRRTPRQQEAVARPRFFLSPPLLRIVIIAAVITLIIYLIGRV
ncbi:MAG: hypothetical protein ACRD1Z_15010, partial [Vicinamibacteria bacterium]